MPSFSPIELSKKTYIYLLPTAGVDLEKLILGIFLTITSLTVLWSISNLGLISGLPNDMRLGWGVAVMSGLVISFASVGRFSEKQTENLGKGEDVWN